MIPAELADKHPHLYQVTDPRNWDGIQTHGLPSTHLQSLFEYSDAARAGIKRQRRPESMPLTDPVHGKAIITDNRLISSHVESRPRRSTN